MRIPRPLTALVALLAALSLVAACGDDDGDTTSDTTAPAEPGSTTTHT